MFPWGHEWRGRLDEHSFESAVLRGNPLGDPHVRPLWVYVPPGYDDEPGRRYASVYVIQGLTGQLDMWRNRSGFGERTFLELTDELFSAGEAPPAIVVFVDAWTSLGGSQFVDSPATGRYHTYLCDELVPWVDEHYRTLPEPAHRGIQGKSSGGYGAMITPMLRPDLFGGLATHAGDSLFETVFLPDFRDAARTLRDRYDGSFERFWEDFRARHPVGKPGDPVLINTYCMAACYSANEDGSIDFPFELETGKLRPDVWERWLAWDPVRMAPRYADALRGLRAIYVDAGTRDQFYLDLGATAFRDALAEIGVTDVEFDLFDGTHSGIVYRYPRSLRYLAERLAP
jgi:hypothetical protein